MEAVKEKENLDSVNGNDIVISEDEAALYDRQIRLWGVEAQKKLRSANILLINISGVGSEIAKNVVLSGVNSLTILDSNKIVTEDMFSNIFTKQNIGEYRATASEPLIKSLNPMVKVLSKIWNIDELLNETNQSRLKELMKNVNVVVLTGSGKGTATKLNSFIHEFPHKILFFWANVWGFYGFSFTDLGKGYNYLSEEVISSEISIGDKDIEPLKKKVKTDDQEKQILKKTLDYPSLNTALSIKAGKSGVGLTKRISPIFALMHIMLEFHSKNSMYPKERSEEKFLKEIQKEVIDNLGLDQSIGTKLDALKWWEQIYGEVSPVTSIVGGVIGQDIIRSISAKETPIKNFFLFNGIECNGVIESVGK